MKKKLHFILPAFFILCFSFLALSQYKQTGLLEEELKISNDLVVVLSSSEDNLALQKAELPLAVRKDTNVLLTVDTQNITEDNKEEFVKISDDRLDLAENSSIPSQHVALVDRNMKIYWSAEALDPQLGITVDVLGIFRKADGGSEILDGVFRDPNKDGIIMGKIKNKKVEGLEYYNIMIRINDETPRTFLIDPKLQMSK